ncbi:MAG: PQQ-dependent sugar dehydrogenase, partial [Actinomycetota bacterium]
MRRLAALLLVALVAFTGATPVPALSNVLEAGFVETLVAHSPDFRSPDAMKFSADGRLFVLEQSRGAVRIVENGVMLTTPLITVPVQTGGSRGLLGIAFHPNFATNGFFYLVYTTNAGGVIHNRLSRFTATGNTASTASEVVLFELGDLADKTMHYGGDINFGPDGKLYMSVGDRLQLTVAQQIDNTWGKMLRLNADGSIPTDNPFYNQTTGVNRAIWALGLRNPFKFTFDDSGQMLINDVGGMTWEEVNVGAPGANYGWPDAEGPSSDPRFTDPIYAYNHTTGVPSGCAIMGGDVYEPDVPQLPAAYVGRYLFPDHCQGWLKAFDLGASPVTNLPILTGLVDPVDVKVGPQGEIYALQRQYNGSFGGALYRIDYVNDVTLQILQQPGATSGPIGGSATFSVIASGTPPLSYQWLRNGTAISGATSSVYTLQNLQPSDSGAGFSVRVTDPTGNVTSDTAVLTVTSNHRPQASIDTPLAGTTYAAGEEIAFSGSATDVEDGVLASGDLTWEVVFHHNTHTHPFIDPFSGAGGSFTVPRDLETDADVFVRIHLTATDTAGDTHEVTRDVTPRTSNLTLRTVPTGLGLLLDAQPTTTPKILTGVEGVSRLLTAPATQIVGGTTYQFQGWSDGGAREHSIVTPVNDTTFTATYSADSSSRDAVLVVADPAVLGTEARVVTRLQGLGFSVQVRDDDGLSAGAATGAELLVIPSSVVAGKIGAMFRSTPVPVLVWKPFLYDDMLMTDRVRDVDYGTVTGQRTVAIQSIQHPLAPRGAETLTILSAARGLAYGVPPLTADRIGTSGGRDTLFSFSAGDALFGGTVAAG